MPKKLLEKSCVRIQIKGEQGELHNHGTGVIVNCHDDFYVLTADHCIYGDENQFHKLAETNNIWVERQNDYVSDFHRIPVLEVIERDPHADWVLLKIEDPGLDISYSDICLGENFIQDDKVFFRGYQHLNKDEARLWEGTVQEVATNEFKITLNTKTFNQGGEFGKTIANGLSGSGVYIIRGKKVYLIGHLKSVVNEIALNDDIRCCHMNKLKGKINANFVDLGSAHELDFWEREEELKLTEKDIEEWGNANVQYYNNLKRKLEVLYTSHDKVKTEINDRLLDFLQQECKYNSVYAFSDVIVECNRMAVTFEKTVRRHYCRNVSSANEAKDLVIQLEKDFAKHIEPIVNDKNNARTFQLAQHKVTLWLLNCSLDFTE